MRTAPDTEYSENFYVRRAHDAQKEERYQPDQADQHADHCLKHRNTKWTRGRAHGTEPTD